jgi:deoxyribonuclease V
MEKKVENEEVLREQEIAKKYNLDLDKLEKEQIKLAKSLEIKDKVDFSLFNKFGAIVNTFIKSKIFSCIIVCNENYEVIDRAYVIEKLNFPYLARFRSYRELPAMLNALGKLNEKPDIIFVQGQGIATPILGLASHFSLASGIPTMGVSESLVGCDIKGEDIFKDDKKVGKLLITKPGSRPMYLSPGNQISVETAFDIAKKSIKLPHKKPEPIHLAKKYLKKVISELKIG